MPSSEKKNGPGRRCNQSSSDGCRYFRWKDCPGICSPFPQCLGSPPRCPTNNCELHAAAGPFLPGDSEANLTTTGWLAGAPPPRDAPSPGAVVSAAYDVTAEGGLGLEWEGVGAISGGGATTKLLLDYDPVVASDILDYMFLPDFGLGLQMLKVEIGGDTDATEGAESSHMHTAADPGNYNRGCKVPSRCRCVAAGVRQMTTTTDRCSGAANPPVPPACPSRPLPLGHCWDGLDLSEATLARFDMFVHICVHASRDNRRRGLSSPCSFVCC